MRKTYVRIKDFIGGRLHCLCDRLSPRQRTVTVLVAAVLFALVNFYMSLLTFRNLSLPIPSPRGGYGRWKSFLTG